MSLSDFDFLKDDSAEKALELMENALPQCTKKQRAYIYSMCNHLGYDPRDMPLDVSPKGEVRDLNIEEAEKLIKDLIDLGGDKYKDNSLF